MEDTSGGTFSGNINTQGKTKGYIDGQVYAMAGTTDTHNIIGLNFTFIIRNHLRGSGCRVYFADVKVRLEKRNHFYYPDIIVTCDDRDRETATYKSFPKLIIEVLSDSTEAFDRGDKFNDYQTRYEQVFDGYQATQTISFSAKKNPNLMQRIESVSSKTSELVNSGIELSSNTIQYTFSDLPSLKQSLIEKATKEQQEAAIMGGTGAELAQQREDEKLTKAQIVGEEALQKRIK